MFDFYDCGFFFFFSQRFPLQQSKLRLEQPCSAVALAWVALFSWATSLWAAYWIVLGLQLATN